MNRIQVASLILSLLTAVALGGLGYHFQEALPPWAIGLMAGLPLLAGVILVFIARERPLPEAPPVPKEVPEEERPPSPSEKPEPGASPSPEPFVAAFLGALQREGRFLDFLNEDLEAYDDAQIGAAVRTIHRGLKTAVFEMIKLKPVIEAQEGSEIVIEEGFNPKEIKLIGNVKGRPPFKGFLRHPGWRYEKIELPKPRSDRILAPAEVEIP